MESADLIVVGAGCAGMATALFAAVEGMKVLLVEATPWVGGTSALSAGAIWIPNSHLSADSGDTPEQAARYLGRATGGEEFAVLRERFLDLGPEAVRCLADHTDVQLRAFPYHPDYLSELSGATTHGRVLECLPFDGRQLGADLLLVRPPIPEFTVLGGMMVDRVDISHLLNMTRSRESFMHAARLLLRHAGDRMRYPRGARLVMGNALVGRLLMSLRRRGVPLWTRTRADRLIVQDGRVAGVRLVRDGHTDVVHARCGVVLAGGGFNDHPALRRALIPPEVTHTPRAATAGGELLAQALDLGARMNQPRGSAAFWAPVSVRRRSDGSTAVFPHFVLDRAKPGTVVVDASGRRFVNESVSYHLFGEAMLACDHDARCRGLAYLIADHRALVRYGLGMVRPGGRGLARFLRDGYLARAPSVAALAERLAIPADVLEATVDRLNAAARSGVDSDFQRGSTAYQRNLGDPAIAPNPTLGQIDTAPYYAVQLRPGDLAASAGLVTNAEAQVLRGEEVIDGLFAVGNDMQSIMGSAYPGPGINLGPAIVFALAAARAARGNAMCSTGRDTA
ncbi:MAG TPA: FAD-dependent oxidoreductase [Burkholderiaceae bacterium]